jgi:hypothetical protein
MLLRLLYGRMGSPEIDKRQNFFQRVRRVRQPRLLRRQDWRRGFVGLHTDAFIRARTWTIRRERDRLFGRRCDARAERL